jgi:4-hydroxybenzoate polyprenyltransferase
MPDPRPSQPNLQTGTPARLRALAASARLANVPSVVSNVCVGAVIAKASGADTSMITAGLPFVIASGICLYLAGNFLNDWHDREWDVSHRPERALPRGLFKPGIYLSAASVLFMSGIALAAGAGVKSLAVASAIMVFVLIYTAIHKRSAWSVIPMGLCRALLPSLGFLGCLKNTDTTDIAVGLALGYPLFCYIAGLSLSARNAKHLSWLPGMLFAISGLSAAALAHYIFGSMPGVYVALAAYALWVLSSSRRFRNSVSSHVSALLAGIPLVDWIFILPSSHGFIWVPLLAVLAGIVLQRLAPAT